MVERARSGSTRQRWVTSPRDRAQWRQTYQDTPYEQLPWFDPEPTACVRQAVGEGYLPKGGAVLDVGCGAGSNVLFLATSGYQTHGIDLSPGAVAAARARAADAGLDVDVQEGDALALPFPDSSLDAVVDVGCFHTLPFSRRGRYSKQVHRVLRPDGRLVLSWVAREHISQRGPPHRPSLGEVTAVFESRFLFVRTGFQSNRAEGEPSTYFAYLSKRSGPYPPRR